MSTQADSSHSLKIEQRTLDNTVVHLASPITSDMTEAVKAQHLIHNKNALIASDTTWKTKVEVFKQVSGCHTSVDIQLGIFKEFIKDNLGKASSLIVKSYHSKNGYVVNDAIDPETGKLKVVDKVAYENRRADNIKYAKVTRSLNFKDLEGSLYKEKETFIHFIDLPTKLKHTAKDDKDKDVTLDDTYIGATNWDSDETKFKEVTERDDAIGKPFDLKTAGIDGDEENQEAKVDIASANTRLEELKCKAAWLNICTMVQKEICPNITNDPVTDILAVSQTVHDNETGTTTILSVYDYFDKLKIAISQIPKTGNWPIDVVQHYINGLIPTIKERLKSKFTHDPATASLHSSTQWTALLDAYQKSLQCEKAEKDLSGKIEQHLQGNHSFMASVNMSSAEKVLASYNKDKGNDSYTLRDVHQYLKSPESDPKSQQCWGCGSPNHSFIKNGIVVCPYKHINGVKEAADQRRNTFNKQMKEKRNKRKNNRNDRSDKKRKSLVSQLETLITKISAKDESRDDEAICLAVRPPESAMDVEENAIQELAQFMDNTLVFHSAYDDVIFHSEPVVINTDFMGVVPPMANIEYMNTLRRLHSDSDDDSMSDSDLPALIPRRRDDADDSSDDGDDGDNGDSIEHDSLFDDLDTTDDDDNGDDDNGNDDNGDDDNGDDSIPEMRTDESNPLLSLSSYTTMVASDDNSTIATNDESIPHFLNLSPYIEDAIDMMEDVDHFMCHIPNVVTEDSVYHADDDSSGLTRLHTLIVNSTTSSPKPALPLKYENNLPHFNFRIGTGGTIAPLSCLYDCGAVCNVGFAPFHLAIAKALPCMVKQIRWANNQYSPLRLSGVVTERDESGKKKNDSTCTELPAIIEYKTPYTTSQGSPVTISIAIGNNVGVNTIIGMNMIRNGKFSFDMDSELITSSVINTKPWVVGFKPTNCGIPEIAALKHLYDRTKSENPKREAAISQLASNVFTAICMQSKVAKPGDSTSNDSIDEKLGIWTEVLSDVVNDDATIITSNTTQSKAKDDDESCIKVPKKKYRKKLASKWKEPPRNGDPNQKGYEILSDSIYNPSSSLRRNIQQFKDPTPDPRWKYTFSEEKDRATLMKQLIFDDHLSERLKKRVENFVIEYYDVFREEGLSIPVRGYEMIIDTGDNQPTCVPQPHYGLHESPIMQKSIDALIKLGFIIPDYTSPFGARITLAPKPHQEDVKDIKNFVWRFCINYIHLNRITRPTSYPIPRCDDAIMYGFGSATYFILMDAHSGYHQVSLSKCTRHKTAFYAPHGRKYIYVVMPFGLRNAPAVFVAMMHDLKALWTDLCHKYGIKPSHDEGTTIIIDDIFVFAVSEDNSFIILECIAKISRKYHLTLKLKKCQWFPNEVEFVGVDVSTKGNSPAKSKFEYLKTWKTPKTPRDIMSFIGFGMFYSRWIPFFEIKISPLRAIIKTYPIDHELNDGEFTANAMKAYNEVKDAILKKPILQRADINLRMYLKTDFSSLSLGFALCQPEKTAESIKAMEEEIAGGECKFDLTLKGLRLLPIAFGSRKTVGNEKHFHSFPGEALCAVWAILKNRHFLWGKEFTLLTDCRALLWITNYDGHNHAVKRLQLELHGYYFTVSHRPGRMMEDANYLSRLHQETSIDPLLRDYLSFARQAYSSNTPPTSDEIDDDNLPGRRKKAKYTTTSTTDSADINSNFAMLHMDHILYQEIEIPSGNPSHTALSIQNIPVSFSSDIPYEKQKNIKQGYNQYCASTAVNLNSSSWCLVEPKFGHWLDACRNHSIPFICPIAIESLQACRNTLQMRHSVPYIFSTIQHAIDSIRTAIRFHIQGFYSTFSKEYILHQSFQIRLNMHLELLKILHQHCYLKMAIFEFHHEPPCSLLTKFQADLLKLGWKCEKSYLKYNYFSDHITGAITILTCSHRSFYNSSADIPSFDIVKQPIQPIQLSEKLITKFNTIEFALPKLEDLFKVDIINDRNDREASVLGIIKSKDKDTELGEHGYRIYDSRYPAPLPTPRNNGLFGQLFGIVFEDIITGKSLCRAISSLEYIQLFGYSNDFSYNISNYTEDFDIFMMTTPCRTLTAILNSAYGILSSIQQREINANSIHMEEAINPSVFLNGIINHQLPDDNQWRNAYQRDSDCQNIINMLQDPSLIIHSNINKVHYIYRSPLRNSLITYENDRLIYHEPTIISNKTVKLIIVPADLRMHIFNSFHTNPLGGHFSLYQTLHRIRIRFHWPNMYQFIKARIKSCAACILKNNSARPSSELLYGFPLDAPMNTIHADLWSPGNITNFDGDKSLMIVTCHMTGFSAIEPVQDSNSKAFAKAVYKIMMRYGLANLIVTDPDSKFKKEFKSMCELLQIPHHLSSKGNHNAIIVERFNKFLNQGMRIFAEERGTPRVFLEAAETLCYAWNSAPVAGTDLSRSLLVVGREFRFPIDISNNRHLTLDVNESSVESYAKDLTSLLEKCRDVYALLISEHRAMHREYRNAQLSNPKKFKLHDIVFMNVQVQSKAKQGKVAKLSYTRRGPYKIINSYPSGSYELELVSNPSAARVKKHGSQLILCPKDLLPHQPIQSSDQIFSEFNKKTLPNPFKEAHIEGYTPATPWASSAAAAHSHLESSQPSPSMIASDTAIEAFPTVEDLDEEFDSWPELSNPFSPTTVVIENSQGTSGHNTATCHSSATISGTDNTTYSSPASITANNTASINSSIPQFSSLIQQIIKSDDKLFFISYKKPNEQRREWKLVQLDFKQSMLKSPQCLQDGIFIMNFMIQHPKDDKVSYPAKRFWLEYHKMLNPKKLHTNYIIMQPSDKSPKEAEAQDLVPYREWINIKDSSTFIHGPFNFAIINGRQTRDRISNRDWQILMHQKHMYNNETPAITDIQAEINVIRWNEPIEFTGSNKEVTIRVNTFINEVLPIEENDTLHAFFGTTQGM